MMISMQQMNSVPVKGEGTPMLKTQDTLEIPEIKLGTGRASSARGSCQRTLAASSPMNGRASTNISIGSYQTFDANLAAGSELSFEGGISPMNMTTMDSPKKSP